MASDRKISKRQAKYKNIINKDYHISTENKPSKSLMICNAGLVNNCRREYIIDSFQKYGLLDAVVMPENKSYCFISFKEESSSELCYNEANGKVTLPCVNGPLYLLFVDQIPSDCVLSTFGELPHGLHILENYVTEVEEAALLKCIRLDDSVNAGELKNRLVKHYGYEFLYGCNNIDRNSPLDEKIPDECDFLFRYDERGVPHNLIPWAPDQLTVNYYKPGQGIPSHIDTHSAFEDPIMSLSLGSDVVMDFKRNSNAVSVLLPRRSLLIMSGESRYAWTHGICPRKFDTIPYADGGLTTKDRGSRTSFTFRRIRHTPCSCQFKSFCDSQNVKCDITDEIAHSLENTYVHDVYNKISEHFSDTRHKPWPNVLDFVKSFPCGSVIVDVGCGNGKYFGHSSNMIEIGLDQCKNLVSICRERGFESLQSNCLALPLKSSIADCVICIAVIHHLSTKARRIQAIREMSRILKIQGKMLIYAWAKDQSLNNKASSYLKQSRKNRKADYPQNTGSGNEQQTDYNNSAQQSQEIKLHNYASDISLTLPLHENRTAFQHHDLLVPWKLKKEAKDDSYPTFLRFYHVFEENEIEELCRSVEEVEIEKSYYDQGNWCVILKKTSVNT